MAKLPEVTEQSFEREVLASELPVLLEFGATWCAPCKTVAPELEAIAAELKGKAKVATVDIDRSPLLAQELGIQSVPTFVVFHQGRPVAAKGGVMRRAQLRELVEKFLPRAVGAIKPEELAKLLTSRQVCPVDTREAVVFRRNHLPGATHLALEDLPARIEELQSLPGVPVLYCRSGDRTKELAEKLASEGMPVSFLEGGVLAWEAAGFTLERPD